MGVAPGHAEGRKQVATRAHLIRPMAVLGRLAASAAGTTLLLIALASARPSSRVTQRGGGGNRRGGSVLRFDAVIAATHAVCGSSTVDKMTTLVVSANPAAPCCGGPARTNQSVGRCLSIAAAHHLQKDDHGCDAWCRDARDFFDVLHSMRALQATALAFVGVASALWTIGMAAWHWERVQQQARLQAHLKKNRMKIAARAVLATRTSAKVHAAELDRTESADSKRPSEKWGAVERTGSWDSIMPSVKHETAVISESQGFARMASFGRAPSFGRVPSGSAAGFTRAASLERTSSFGRVPSAASGISLGRSTRRSDLMRASPNVVSHFAFLQWFLCCFAAFVCLCVDLGILFVREARENAQSIGAAGCYRVEVYDAVTSQLHNAVVLLFFQAFLSVLVLMVGLYSLYEIYTGTSCTSFGRTESIDRTASIGRVSSIASGVSAAASVPSGDAGSWCKKKLQSAPALGFLLLVVELAMATGGLLLLTFASHAATVTANHGLCQMPKASAVNTTFVGGCVTVLPNGTSVSEYSAQYLKRCGRDTPHVRASLLVGGIAIGELSGNLNASEALLQAIAIPAGVDVAAVTLDSIENPGLGSPRRKNLYSSLVSFFIDTTSPAESAQAAHMLEQAAYGDELLSSINDNGLGQVTSAKLQTIAVISPGQQECSAGQFVPEGSNGCEACTAGFYCLGKQQYSLKCANGDSSAGSSKREDCQCFEGFGGDGQCMNCSRIACTAGEYNVGCGGKSKGSCKRCGPCNAGSYRDSCTRNMEGTCKNCPKDTYSLGTKYRSACSLCSTLCPAGKFVSGCGGLRMGTCVACNLSCPLGQYLAGCGGVHPGECKPCKTCPGKSSCTHYFPCKPPPSMD